MINFLLMTVGFSINHGTVTAALNFAGIALSETVGGTATGVLYVFYTLTALLFAAGVVKQFGAKWSLTGALCVYAVYVGSFFWAVTTVSYGAMDEVSGKPIVEPTTLTWVVACGGGAMGGLGAGWLWTAQGIFFGRTAKLYARASGLSLLEVNSMFAGIFSTCYVGFEVIIKAIASPLVTAGPKVLPHAGDHGFMALVFTMLAAVSTLIMIFVKDVPELEDTNKGPAPTGCEGVTRKAALAGELFLRERKIRLLGWLQAAFGFTAAFVIGFVNVEVVPIALSGQPSYVTPLMFSVIPFVAAVISLPMTKVANIVGKGPLMMLGASAYALLSFLVTVLDEKQLGELGLGIVVVYILMGFGRAVFENTNKAVFADFFPQDTEAAFANVIVESGASSALAFFIFPALEKWFGKETGKIIKGSITVVTSLIAIVALHLAFKQYKNEQLVKTLENEDEEAGVPPGY